LSQPIFRWNGDPVAFVEDWHLFDCQGRYLGWIETDNSVWAANGQHVGDLLDGEHIFRSTTGVPRVPRLARAAPRVELTELNPLPPKRMSLPPMYGWIDAFDLFYPVPGR